MTTEAPIQADATAAASPAAGEAASPGTQDAATNPAPATAPSGAAEPAAQADASPASDGGLVRPEGLADEFWDAQTGVKTADLLAAYQELKGAADAAKSDVPADATGYELKLSEGVKVPEGFKVEINAEDPFFADVTKELHGLGIGQAGVQKLVDAYARAQIAEQEQAVEAYTAEKGKLGERAQERIGAVQAWVTANLPKEQAAALIGSIYNAAQVQAFERIIKLRSDASPAPGGQPQPSALEGLRGAELLEAIRANKAA